MEGLTLDGRTTDGGEQTLLAGRYRVVRPLGQGGMGAVWLAEDTKLENRPVAVKMLPTVLLSSPRSYRQIKSEALVSLKLTHSNIATLRGFEENDGNPFLVIDYIDGQSLDAILAERVKLSEEETARLLRPVAAAIDYAHREKVIHRDIKPGNVMVRRDGVPFVLDFGIAREVQETLTQTTGTSFSGTLMYMSPEQLAGAVPSPAQDVYSFAAMAYECLTGHPPFHRGQIEYQILNMEPEPLASDSPFARSVMASLSKNPAARAPTCRAVVDPGGAPVADAARQIAPTSILRPDAGRTAAEPRAAASRGAHLDVDIYLLEDEARTLYEQTISKLPEKVHPVLDGALALVKRNFRAAGRAVQRGDAESARALFSAVVDFPVQRREMARDEAKKAFDRDDLAAAFALTEAADSEDPTARFIRGYCRQAGAGTDRDLAAACADYLAAAEAGHPAARYNLATMLLEGAGVKRDAAAAVKWFRAASEQGVMEACVRLGMLLDEGRAVVRDPAMAFDCYYKVHCSGDARFAVRLGELCAEGQGRGLDPVQRHALLEAAAAKGSAVAACALGEQLLAEGRPELEEKARMWFERAREAETFEGETSAAARLAEIRARREAARRAEEVRRREMAEWEAAARAAEICRREEAERDAAEARAEEMRLMARRASVRRWRCAHRRAAACRKLRNPLPLAALLILGGLVCGHLLERHRQDAAEAPFRQDTAERLLDRVLAEKTHRTDVAARKAVAAQTAAAEKKLAEEACRAADLERGRLAPYRHSAPAMCYCLDGLALRTRGKDLLALGEYRAARENLLQARESLSNALLQVERNFRVVGSVVECRPGAEWTIALPGGEKMVLCWCPPGTFTMGSPASEKGRYGDETLYPVTLERGFWMGKYEVTQAQWASVMGTDPSHYKGSDRPVEQVSWEDCQNFLQAIKRAKPQLDVRLPTEAEWEYACRARSTGAYPGSGLIGDMGWYEGNSGDGTHVVGRKKPNAWGLHDMIGNVWEWCADCYASRFHSTSRGDASVDEADWSRYICRGGGWNAGAEDCRSAIRSGNLKSDRRGNLGFRLCCSAEPCR